MAKLKPTKIQDEPAGLAADLETLSDPAEAKAISKEEMLVGKIKALEAALMPFARISFEPDRPDEFIVYTLARGGLVVNLTVADLKAARRALGI